MTDLTQAQREALENCPPNRSFTWFEVRPLNALVAKGMLTKAGEWYRMTPSGRAEGRAAS